MGQHSQIEFAPLPYSRDDYTALRAYCLKLPFSVIERYYVEDSPQRQQGLERYLIKMREDLIERASAANPAIAEVLRKARTSDSITDKALAILIQAANAKPAPPYPHQPIAQWFRARVAQCLIDDGLESLASLIQMIEKRGHSWWRGIPRIGQLRAQAIVRWLKRHANTLGEIDPQYLQPPFPTTSITPIDPSLAENFAPLANITLPQHLAGETGVNRAQQFAFIQAKHDLEAVHAYLSRFHGHTHRVYQKELERFVLWAIKVAKKPLSSLFIDDCEGYKSFLNAPSSAFIGKQAAPRHSPLWRPFNGPLSIKSQWQAVRILRTAFDWLVKVRYLAGNPWAAVRDPNLAQTITPMQIERALPASLWDKLITILDTLCLAPENKQARIARATLLLMGDSGLRRSEAAAACRSQLHFSQVIDDEGEAMEVWELAVLGKRNKWREVPISARTIAALGAHWQDRERDLESGNDFPIPLLSPLTIPPTSTSRLRHLGENHYTGDGLYFLIRKMLKRLIAQGIFSEEEVKKLMSTTAHSFRHTFVTQTIAQGVPVDVVQKASGHASISTTSIYIQAEKKRMLKELGKYYTKTAKKNTIKNLSLFIEA